MFELYAHGCDRFVKMHVFHDSICGLACMPSAYKLFLFVTSWGRIPHLCEEILFSRHAALQQTFCLVSSFFSIKQFESYLFQLSNSQSADYITTLVTVVCPPASNPFQSFFSTGNAYLTNKYLGQKCPQSLINYTLK